MVAAEVSDALRDRWLGRYRLRWKVASGGMGEVWLAQLDGPHGFGKWVAVKIMHPHLASDRRVVDMFLDEARIAARIQHTHVCTVLDFGEQDGTPFLVMEYLHGEPFASVLHAAWDESDAPGLPWWIAVRVVADAARGLHAAHELADESGAPMGLVHRDVSPQNVFVQYEGAAKVVDFGVARATNRVTTTKSGELKGKLAYMAPEQLRRGQVDRRTDVWALGVVLWEAVAGRRLFTSDSEGSMVLAILQDPIPKLADVRKDCPTYLSTLVATVLERAASKRPASAAALADALDRCLFQLGEPAGHAQVGAWMAQTFREQRRTRDAMLRKPTSQEIALPPSRDSSPGSQSSLRSRVPDPIASAPGRTSSPDLGEPIAVAANRGSLPPVPPAVIPAPATSRVVPPPPPRSDATSDAPRIETASTALPTEIQLAPEQEPERITEPPAPPTVRARLPTPRVPVLAIALAGSAAVVVLVAVAVALGVLVGRRTAGPVVVATQPQPSSSGRALPSAASPRGSPTSDPTADPSDQVRASSRPRPIDARHLSPQRGERQGEGPSSGAGSLSPNGETVGARGDPAPIAEPPADMHFDEPVDATGRSVGGRTPRGDPRPAATTRTNELAPARLGMGQVNLLALPAADVTWRGRAMGRTPLALRLPAGRHRLSLRAARGGATTTITVEVRPGRTARRTVRLE